MSVQIKNLTTGVPTSPTQDPPTTPEDDFNTIPTANTIYNLYVAPITPSAKAAIVKSIRLVNTDTNPVTVTLYYNHPILPPPPPPTVNPKYRRVLLTPENLLLNPNSIYIEDTELTLEPGDEIQGKASVAHKIKYLISGVERDLLLRRL